MTGREESAEKEIGRLQSENERIRKRVFELESLLEHPDTNTRPETIYGPLVEPKGKTPRLVFDLLKADQSLTKNDLQVQTGLNMTTIYKAVNYLAEHKFIEWIGQRNNGYWRIFHKEDKLRLVSMIRQLGEARIGGAAWFSPTMSSGYRFAKAFWGLRGKTPLLEFSHNDDLVDSVSETMYRVFSWGSLEHGLLEWLKQFSPLEEFGAGNGYNARLMKDVGIDVIASDKTPPRGSTWFPVEQKTYQEWSPDSARLPILIWPYDEQLHEWIFNDVTPPRFILADSTSMRDVQDGWSTRYTQLHERYRCTDWFDSVDFTLNRGTSAKLWELREK